MLSEGAGLQIAVAEDQGRRPVARVIDVDCVGPDENNAAHWLLSKTQFIQTSAAELIVGSVTVSLSTEANVELSSVTHTRVALT